MNQPVLKLISNSFFTAAESQSLIDATLFGNYTFYWGNQENRTNPLEIIDL